MEPPKAEQEASCDSTGSPTGKSQQVREHVSLKGSLESFGESGQRPLIPLQENESVLTVRHERDETHSEVVVIAVTVLQVLLVTNITEQRAKDLTHIILILRTVPRDRYHYLHLAHWETES